ncbi:hypothetical protein ARAM_003716 [Aspergillus rambellii]|uniref:Uncharacterized protein n=1 Tax=Aspergillus rambellii TaxID=308745 RepID=A0A0F8VR49_9EURO|nr:hypothetical protein ARAM_003716 [Aspergillus rambellii]
MSRKRGRSQSPGSSWQPLLPDEEESTDLKLAILASLHPTHEEETLLEALILSDGSVARASDALKDQKSRPAQKQLGKSGVGHQASLSSYLGAPSRNVRSPKRQITKRGKTTYLYRPEDIETRTPCSIIHNFLPVEEADALLLELLAEVPSYKKQTFQLFGREVSSSHTFCLYAQNEEAAERQKNEYFNDGKKTEDVRYLLPEMRKASSKVQEAVNREIQRRIRDVYPDGKKLKYQSPDPWVPNMAFVNTYATPQENLGYHSDQLTYLGPRTVVGSLSLGVAREFRVRKIVAPDEDYRKDNGSLADAQGQISIHLPHNSLLVMHAEMQEEWKHCIAPARTIDQHPLSGTMRINITYRQYRTSLHPKFMPKCRCGVPTILRCVQQKKENHGRYMWMCHTNYIPGQKGCSFFQWAEFDDDGEPPWASYSKRKEVEMNTGVS